MQKLPIGIQDFETLRDGGYYYVDKTEQLYDLITEGMIYFLSRPRRFGKSLLLSTLKAIFQGKKHLFEDLWIAQTDYNWKEYPVIYLDMSKRNNSNLDNLEIAIKYQLSIVAQKYNIKLNQSHSANLCLDQLIEKLAKIDKIVILIDEYDKPIIDQVNNLSTASVNRDFLKQFYGILKAQNHNLCFVFITGVTKFSKVSVFSGLNSPEDITLTNSAASLLGYTQKEFETTFSEHIKALTKYHKMSKQNCLSKIKQWYNGYQFSDNPVSVYNPYSTLLLLKQQLFSSYWFETATPTFLIRLIKQQNIDVQKLDNLRMAASGLMGYDIERLDTLALLFQTGYLTIKDYNSEYRYYTLGYPNNEVKLAFSESLLSEITEVMQSEQSNYIINMLEALRECDFDEYFAHMKHFIASIPYDLHVKEERYYHSIFYLLLNVIGLTIAAEVHTNHGRIDAIIEAKDKILIFEFKIDKTAKKALSKIKDKYYAEKYAKDSRPCYLIGVNFSTQDRNVNEWLVEQL